MKDRYKYLLKGIALLCIFTLTCLSLPVMVYADAIEGTTVITLGANLTEEQKAAILAELNATEDDEIIYVTNDEEHQYLGNYISRDTIGTRALSSAKITLTPEGSGIAIEINNISWMTADMYKNALVTAGIQDADIYVTAPVRVSGTAALTGMIKAFEVATDQVIPEEQKQVANEEMIRTAELANKIGTKEAVELIRVLKEQLNDRELRTDADYRQLIIDVSTELNIELTDEDIAALVHLLKRLKGLNIDWDQVSNQLQHVRDNLEEFLNAENTKNFIRQVLDFFISLIGQLKTLFSS